MTAPAISAIVPIYNKLPFLRASLDSIVAAAERHGGVELVFVDHQSTDGSWELLADYASIASIQRVKGGTISTVRNHGVRQSRGRLLSFIDCDCIVPPTHFTEMEAVFASTDAVGIGREYDIPASPHWTERTWYDLHALQVDNECRFINAGNLAVRREAFEAVNGFDEMLTVAEDTDICARLRMQGGRLFETRRLNVVHLGNPKSVRDFFRKQVWHGMSILGGGRAMRRNKASLMVLAFAGAMLVAAASLLLPWAPLATRAGAAMVVLLPIPVVTVVYRARETGRVPDPVRGTVLYFIFYVARVTALCKALAGSMRATHRRRLTVAQQGPGA